GLENTTRLDKPVHTVGWTRDKCTMGVQSPSPQNQNQRVYLYTGSESVVPRNIRRVRVIGVGILPKQSFQQLNRLEDVQLPEGLEEISAAAFYFCTSLRTVNFPASLKHIGDRPLPGGTEDDKKLRKILGERSSWNIGKSSLAAVEQVDCFGFNPLHALACSSRQSLDVYRMIVERHPANLIGKDLWGETPFTYVFWSDAPHEVVQYMLRCYRHKFPGGFGVDWNHMLYTLCLGNAPIGGLDKLCEYGHVDLDTMAGRLARPVHSREVKTSSRKTFKFIVERSLADRLSAVSVRRWREEIAREIELIPEDCHGLPSTKRRVHLDKIQSILLKYEKLDASVKEATVSLELALWKIKLYECSRYQMGDDREQESNEERTLDRQEIRLSCGSDVVIENTLPFLIGP
ncbi:hypothetical protein THAOC_31615, partial [Thalassiosira oceanica]